MLHLLYILAFTIIAFLAISNLIRSLITLSTESQRHYAPRAMSSSRGAFGGDSASGYYSVPHPELLDEKGKPVNEPLLVMRSVTVEDARQRLDALYNASPGNRLEIDEEK